MTMPLWVWALVGCSAPLRQELAALQARVARLEAEHRASTAAYREEEQTDQAKQLFQSAVSLVDDGLAAEALTLLRELQAAYPESPYASRATTMYREVALIGSPAPPWEPLAWINGQTTTLSATPWVVIVFFESWCPHCPEQLQTAQAQVVHWRNLGVAWIGATTLSRDVSTEACNTWATELGVTFPLAHVATATNQAWSVTGVPAAAIVHDGVVVWRGSAERITDSLLQGFVSATP